MLNQIVMPDTILPDQSKQCTGDIQLLKAWKNEDLISIFDD